MVNLRPDRCDAGYLNYIQPTLALNVFLGERCIHAVFKLNNILGVFTFKAAVLYQI